MSTRSGNMMMKTKSLVLLLLLLLALALFLFPEILFFEVHILLTLTTTASKPPSSRPWDKVLQLGMEPVPLHWKHRVLTTGPLGKSQAAFLTVSISPPDFNPLVLPPALALCHGFNLDTEKAVIFQNNARGFGQSVVQIQGSR